jgi:hypothetical protein
MAKTHSFAVTRPTRKQDTGRYDFGARLAYDLDFSALFADYPDLTEEDIKASVAYAKGLVEDEERRRRLRRQNIG